MQTLKERLYAYCTANQKEMPYNQNLLVLGKTVIDHLRNIGKDDLVKKDVVTEQFEVNHFPDELVPHVDEIIDRYFKSPGQFMRTARAAHKKTIFDHRTFQYLVELHRCAAFERACEKFSIEFIKGDVVEQSRAVIYTLPYKNAQTYLNLGVLFQKLRTNEKYGDLIEQKKAVGQKNPAAPKRKRIKRGTE